MGEGSLREAAEASFIDRMDQNSYRFFLPIEAMPVIAVIAVVAVTATLDAMAVITTEQQQAACGP